jgi:hypothetical protein
MPHQKKKKADISAFNPRAEFIIQAQNMDRTVTAEDRTAMQNARQRHLQGVGNHDPLLHVVVPDANNLPNARQGGFLNRLETAVDAALTPAEALPPLRPEANRLLEAATLFLHNQTPSISSVTQQPNPTDNNVDGELADTTTVANTTTDIIQEARTRLQQRRTGRLSLDVRLARQQSNRNKAVVINPNTHRELLNLNKAKENRRSERVLKARINEATRFILFLHSHHPELVQSDLHTLLIVASSAQYNTERAKELSLRKIIEKTINETENTDNNQKVIKFNEVLPDIIGDYLCQRIGRQGGGLMRGKAYKNSRSHLAMFFKDHGFRWQDEFAEEVSDLVKGINRVVSKEVQKGHGNIEEGKREMSFEVYKLVNKWLVEMGGKDAIFARAYLLCTWNLICRTENTSLICHKHFLWRSDAVGIPFAHEKTNQEGDSRKTKPRHCYPNPLDPYVCLFTGIFEYLACFPQVLEDHDGLLFPGESQNDRFAGILKDVLLLNEKVVNDMGYAVDDLGPHSIRKGGTTYLTSGSTSGPTGSSVNIRGGWSHNAVRDVYMLYEKAGDQYCGRILAGLPVMSGDFSVLYPEFVNVTVGSTVQEVEQQVEDVSISVRIVLHSIFGKGIRPASYMFLRVGLACSLHHRDTLQENYPSTSIIRSTSLYTSREVLELKALVRISKLGDKDCYAQRVTGIPPHVVVTSLLEQLHEKVDGLVPSFIAQLNQAMDDRTFNGTISEARLKQIIDDNQQQLLLEIRKQNKNDNQQMAIEDHPPPNTVFFTEIVDDENGIVRPEQVFLWNHKDGKLRRVPPEWTFPNCTLSVLWEHWCCGDSVKRISALCRVQNVDVEHIRRGRHTIYDIRFLMGKIEAIAKQKGMYKKVLTREEAKFVYEQCNKEAIPIAETSCNRTRSIATLKWPSVIAALPKELQKRDRKGNPKGN